MCFHVLSYTLVEAGLRLSTVCSIYSVMLEGLPSAPGFVFLVYSCYGLFSSRVIFVTGNELQCVLLLTINDAAYATDGHNYILHINLSSMWATRLRPTGQISAWVMVFFLVRTCFMAAVVPLTPSRVQRSWEKYHCWSEIMKDWETTYPCHPMSKEPWSKNFPPI